MCKVLLRTAAVALSLAWTGVGIARGGIVVEAETDGTAINNTLASAQVLVDADFTTDLPPTVFAVPGNRTATIHGRGGDLDVDFYRFTITDKRTGLLFDIDDDPFSLNTMLTLFDVTGTMIGFNDASYPFLGRIDLNPGVYYIAVSQYPNYPIAFADPFVTGQQLFRPDGKSGGHAVFSAAIGESGFFFSDIQQGLDYTLHISQTVPEPASLSLLLLGLAGLGGTWRSRRRLAR